MNFLQNRQKLVPVESTFVLPAWERISARTRDILERFDFTLDLPRGNELDLIIRWEKSLILSSADTNFSYLSWCTIRLHQRDRMKTRRKRNRRELCTLSFLFFSTQNDEEENTRLLKTNFFLLFSLSLSRFPFSRSNNITALITSWTSRFSGLSTSSVRRRNRN